VGTYAIDNQLLVIEFLNFKNLKSQAKPLEMVHKKYHEIEGPSVKKNSSSRKRGGSSHSPVLNSRARAAAEGGS
jgi:hypothetical protein